MPLKYQNEIDNFNLSIECPINLKWEGGELDAHKFSFAPIENKLNFLPNVLFDRLKGIPFDYIKANELVKCKRCGSSYYDKLDSAITAWNNLSPQVQENLGYTHIALGKLNNQDGYISEISKNGHFGFYENENVDLRLKFKILTSL